jgi:DNA-binding XRE family transcriptional regulator
VRERKLSAEAVRRIRRFREVRMRTPTTEELAHEYGVSRATVQKAERGYRYKDVR